METNTVPVDKVEVEKKEKKPKKGFFKRFTKKKIIIITAIVLVVAILCFFIFGSKNSGKGSALTYVEAVAAVGNITASVEQSGVVEPLDRYEITSLVRGEIISSPFEEGDYVKEGDLLYQIDDEDAQLTLEKAQMSVDEANDNVEKLNIYATATGRLTNFSLSVGDNVGNGLIGNIISSDVLTVDVPFSLNDFNKISVGDDATITSALYMTSIRGKVTHKYYANSEAGSNSGILRNIEIEIKNPGSLESNTTFAATVHTSSGDVNSSASGTISDGEVAELRAEVSGTVAYVGAKNGDYVKKGDLILQITNKSVVTSQKTSQLNLKSNIKTLDNYRITAPISGTVITKNSKAGDNIDSSNSQTVMMVIADMSKMKFTISVDELDISDIQLGQTAIVDADALPDEEFEARVTNISSEGVSSGDGVTTYDIELTIDEPGNLKSGMNVNATIIISQANNVVTIPEDALMSVRGTTATVLVKTDGNNSTKNVDGNNKGKSSESENTENGGAPTRPEGAENGKAPARPEGMGGGEASAGSNGTANTEMPARQAGTSNGSNESGKSNTENQNSKSSGARGASNIPDGCEIRQVEIGISDGTYIEIVSGLSEGETVVYIPSTSSSTTGFNMNMGMMMGGGMPGGGMQGGNRGGGMQGGNRGGNNRTSGGR